MSLKSTLANHVPWPKLVRQLALTHGFVDPTEILSRLDKFARPAEIREPIELLRAGAFFHARGLMNTKAIQHNLDWIWPFWVQRQFDPTDPAFIPRAFSITHINLSHRNWTAVGVPGCQALPIVDPRGLVTPFFDGWSIDGWIVADEGQSLLPSQADAGQQELLLKPDGLSIRTTIEAQGASLVSEVEVFDTGSGADCRIQYNAASPKPAWLVVAIRPANPEGVSLIHDLRLDNGRKVWSIDGRDCVRLSRPADRHVVSDYHSGDVFIDLLGRTESSGGRCDVGMATAAAMNRLEAGQPLAMTVSVALANDAKSQPLFPSAKMPRRWQARLEGVCRLNVPDARISFLYDAAIRTLILHCPDDVYAGPYTYKRFWFRDACMIAHGLLCCGMSATAEAIIDRFPQRQTMAGYFHSQEGEWDSNGQVLWIMNRWHRLTGGALKPEWRRAIVKGGEWIIRKRLANDTESPHGGLMPAGFSAEHFGPVDFYYWDDYWSIAGLDTAATMAASWGESAIAESARRAAGEMLAAVDASLRRSPPGRRHEGIPASPYRRMDAGAIGSMAADYPLQIYPEKDERIMATVDYLLKHCFYNGAFFQDITHSGLNVYLTLHVAQVLLRAGDRRALDVIKTVAALASPTGQWPEAIHPRTGGGCMGDGQHAWAAAEWIIMVRNMFVREEKGRLILLSGLPPEWLGQSEVIQFGPAPTLFGRIDITVRPGGQTSEVTWSLAHSGEPPTIEVRIPEFSPAILEGTATGSVSVSRVESVKEQS